MRSLAFLLFVVTVASGCAAQRRGEAPPSATISAGDHQIELRHDGRLRRYLVHVPPGAATARPVMLALHGGGGSGSQFRDDNGLDAVSDRHGFIAVYPDGTGPLRNRLLTWNAGDGCCGFARDRDIDDVGFLAAVIDDLGRRIAIDGRRVYVTGHSNGAMMAYRLAAERAGLVAAIVPVGGAMMVNRFNPSRPVAVLHIHSVDDPRALYDGGLGPPFPGTDNRVMHRPVMAGLEAWARHNGCGPTPSSGTRREGTGDNAGQSVTMIAWSGCRDGGLVQHLRLTGVGHGWPGAEVRAGMRAIIGPGTTLIDAGQEAWTFASRFTR